MEDSSIVLTDNDIDALKKICKAEELPNLEYTDIRLSTIISGSVYLLIARKPDHYGIKIVLSKDANNWVVLKKVKSIE